jgi:hypothetical protein
MKPEQQTESANPGRLHPVVMQRLDSLQIYWECKAEECERWEKHYAASDRVTSQQSKASKEVYRTCIRELRRSLHNAGVNPTGGVTNESM